MKYFAEAIEVGDKFMAGEIPPLPNFPDLEYLGMYSVAYFPARADLFHYQKIRTRYRCLPYHRQDLRDALTSIKHTRQSRRDAMMLANSLVILHKTLKGWHDSYHPFGVFISYGYTVLETNKM